MTAATPTVVDPDGGLTDMSGEMSSHVYREAIRAFADVAAALLETRERDELLRLVGRRLCELVGAPRCSVYLREESTGLYRGQVGYADHDIDALVKRLTCGTDADGFTREIVETQAPVVIENMATDPRPVKSTVRDWHIVSMMGVPMVLRGEVIGIVFLDAEDQAQKFSPLDCALASAFAELAAVAIAQGELYANLRESLDTVARQNQVLRRVSAVDDKLTGLVLDGRNLREIAEAVTELTHKPCSIHDADGHRMASASPPSQDEPVRSRLLDADMVVKPEIADALAALTPKKAAVVGPFPSAGLPYRFLVAPVTVRDDQWATLVVMEHGARLSGFDMLMSRRTATVIALELSAERRAANAEWNARASLAGELIRGNTDVAQLESRAHFVGMDLEQPHVLCLIGSRADDVTVPDARTAGDAFRAAAPHTAVVAAGVAEGVVVIVEAPADLPALAGVEAVKELVATVCGELDSDGGLVAGLSTICRSPADYVRAYAQARQVVQCLDTFHRAGSVDILAADDLGAGRMFLANADADEAQRFVDETLGGLLDDAVGGDLLLTLSSFFDHGRSIRWSAVDLGVHENTVRYRLSRIEELTGLAVSGDSDAQLSAQLALLVLRLQGLLPRRETSVAPPAADAS
jgi:sugar diacid utilization regulator